MIGFNRKRTLIVTESVSPDQCTEINRTKARNRGGMLTENGCGILEWMRRLSSMMRMTYHSPCLWSSGSNNNELSAIYADMRLDLLNILIERAKILSTSRAA